jgi:hypothetical protein
MNPPLRYPRSYGLSRRRSIPFTTYAKFVVDTATSLGRGGDKGFSRAGHKRTSHALELLYELKRPVTIRGLFRAALGHAMLKEGWSATADLLETPRRVAVHAHFTNRLISNPWATWRGRSHR